LTKFAKKLGATAGILSLPFLFVAFDILLDKGSSFLLWGGAQWKVWLTGLAWDLSAWLAFLWVVARLLEHPRPALRRLGWTLVAIDSVALAMASLVSVAYHREYHNLPNVQALYFAIKEWRNSLTFATEYMDPRGLVALVVAIPALVGLHRLALTCRARLAGTGTGWPRRIAGASPLLVALGVAPLALGWHRFQEPLPLLANWSRIFFQAGLGAFGNKTNLQAPARTALPLGKPTWNVVLILDESLRADAFVGGLGLLDSLAPKTLAPAMQAWLSREDVVVFPNARANSTATSVSVPSLITGVATHGTTYQFHRSPTLFTAARASGLRNFLLSSQDWNWEHLDEFAFGGIDKVLHRGSFPVERTTIWEWTIPSSWTAWGPCWPLPADSSGSSNSTPTTAPSGPAPPAPTFPTPPGNAIRLPSPTWTGSTQGSSSACKRIPAGIPPSCSWCPTTGKTSAQGRSGASIRSTRNPSGFPSPCASPRPSPIPPHAPT